MKGESYYSRPEGMQLGRISLNGERAFYGMRAQEIQGPMGIEQIRDEDPARIRSYYGDPTVEVKLEDLIELMRDIP